MANKAIVVEKKDIVIHEVEDTAQLEALLQSGEINQGDLVLIRKTGNVIKIDAELSDESENPVQNKVIKAALDKKIETIHIAKNTDIDKLFS